MRWLLKRKLVWAPILVGLTLASSLFFYDSDRITEENSGRIQPGMTFPQVIAILGEPDPCIVGAPGLDPKIPDSLGLYWHNSEEYVGGILLLVEFDRPVKDDVLDYDRMIVLRSEFTYLKELSIVDKLKRRWTRINWPW
jgi:hypothetical protein